MQYGIHVPNFGPYSDARVLAELARDAEQAGWDGFFLWDHLAQEWPDSFVDTTVAMTAIALHTKRIRFGPMVTPLARRRPSKLARETVSLDQLSDGRLTLGVGLGIVREEFEMMGEESDPKVRAAMLDEGLDVLTHFWSGEAFMHEGTHYSFKDVSFTPKPLQQPRVPVWVAGTWPNKAPFRRAAKWDGAFPLRQGVFFNQMMSADDMRECVDYMRSQRTSDAPFDVAHWGISKDARDNQVVMPYVEAGVTWWVENVSPWVYGWDWSGAWPVEAMRERILQGPPRI
jgi:alkanesulfonate monooxygenase SsuD/methylene tetrahydromethanopterin reductase-like flavin-dependent oxidoreductase (luciferase family)